METGLVVVFFFQSLLMSIDTSFLHLGIVEEGNTRYSRNTEMFYSYNITIHKYFVDTNEQFQTFNAVYNLNKKHGVDVIVILHDGNMESIVTSGLTISNQLIHWGRTPSYLVKGTFGYKRTKSGYLTKMKTCSVVELTNSKEPYCLNSSEVIEILSSINAATRFRKQVEIRGSSILSTIIAGLLKWKEVFIFYEDDTEDESSRLIYRISKENVKAILYNIDKVTDLHQLLFDAYLRIVPTTGSINFVVLCKFKCLRRLLHTANIFDNKNKLPKTLIKQFSRWLIASFDNHNSIGPTLEQCAHDLDNVAVISFPRLQYEDSALEFAKALRKAIFNEVTAEETGSFNFSVTNVSEAKSAIINALAQKSTSWRSVDRCEGLKVETLMWTNHGRAFSQVGFVLKRGEVFIYADMFPNTKFGYNGRKFLISTLHFAPFVIKTVINGTAHYGGICMDLLTELAWRLNFTYTLTEPPDQTWGRPGPNNTFNGMIGQLQREEVDIVAADTTIQKERELVMDFMFPFYYGYTSVLIKKPDPNAGKWKTLVDPLQWKVLMTIGICLPIMSLILSLIEKNNPFYYQIDYGGDFTWPNVFRSFSYSLWYMYGALFAQGSVNLPQTVAGRTLVCSWWLFAIVIVGTYCGNLIAFLTVTKDKPPFETLDEMADQKGTYQWGLQGGTNREFVFETSKRPEFRRVGDAIAEFSRKDPTVLATDFDVQLKKVKKGFYGWIGDAVVMEIEMAKDCDLMMIKDKFLPLRYAFGFTNNSPHEQIFTKQMLVIHESGLIQVWKRRWWPKSKAVCAGSIVAEAKPISVIDVQSAFYIAAGGAVISFCVFVVELLIGKYCLGRMQKSQSRHFRRNSEN